MSIDILNLEKKFTLNLEKAGGAGFVIPTLATRLAVDKSGSMQYEFASGLVERTIALFTAAALKFDDDGKLEMGFFNQEMTLTEDAIAGDNGNYLKRVRQSAGGGTCYAPIIREFETTCGKVADAPKPGFFGSLFGKKAAAVDDKVREHRAYVGIITDGDPSDHRQFEAAMANTSGDTFYQFIAIGNEVTGRYLTTQANLYPHMSFLHIPEPNSITDDQFYEALCNDKLVQWIKSA